jgi:hypothetical protein
MALHNLNTAITNPKDSPYPVILKMDVRVIMNLIHL